jgi:hypothetical protein
MRLYILLMAASFAFAQEKPAEPKPDNPAETIRKEPFEAEIIPVKTLTGDSFDRLMNLLSVFNAQVKGSAALKTIVVYAPKDVVTQMRRVVEQLDQPGSEAAIGRNIDMTLTLLRSRRTWSRLASNCATLLSTRIFSYGMSCHCGSRRARTRRNRCVCPGLREDCLQSRTLRFIPKPFTGKIRGVMYASPTCASTCGFRPLAPRHQPLT